MKPTMMSKSTVASFVLTLVAAGGTAAAEAQPAAPAPKPTPPSTATPTAPPSGEIELWVRGPGKGADDTPRVRTLKLDLDKLPLVDGARFDAQYTRSRPYRGIALGAVIERFAPEPSLNLAILHFANGMAVPLPFRDDAVMKRLDPLIARGMGAKAKDPIQIGVFPGIPKRNARADARPIVFGGNKIVVAALWHPALGDKEKPVFSPWSHTDTLTSIEFVASKPYYAQFDVDGDAQVQRGLALFQKSCQFCHGVRQVGAKFGMDFVEPIPIHKWKNLDRRFYWHVKYRRPDPVSPGEMPALTYMTEEDASAVWAWLRSAAEQPLRAYQPPR